MLRIRSSNVRIWLRESKSSCRLRIRPIIIMLYYLFEACLHLEQSSNLIFSVSFHRCDMYSDDQYNGKHSIDGLLLPKLKHKLSGPGGRNCCINRYYYSWPGRGNNSFSVMHFRGFLKKWRKFRRELITYTLLTYCLIYPYWAELF